MKIIPIKGNENSLYKKYRIELDDQFNIIRELSIVPFTFKIGTFKEGFNIAISLWKIELCITYN